MRELHTADGLPRGLQADQTARALPADAGSAATAISPGQTDRRPSSRRPLRPRSRCGARNGMNRACCSLSPYIRRARQAGHHRRACLRPGGAGLAGCPFPARQPGPMPHYARRREQLFLVAVQCAEPAATCFCASTGDGPTPTTGYDLTLAELADGFVVVAGSDKGEAVFTQLESAASHAAADRGCPATRPEAAAAAQTRSLPGRNLRDSADEPAGASALGRGGDALSGLRQLHGGVPDLFLPCRDRRTQPRWPVAANMSASGIRASASRTATCTASMCGPTFAAATASG